MTGQILPELNILKVPRAGLVGLDPLEPLSLGPVLTGDLNPVRGGDIRGEPAQFLLLLLLLSSLSLTHLCCDSFGGFSCRLKIDLVSSRILEFQFLGY